MYFERHENIEPENRGWILDKLSAMIDGVEVGYLKIAYIPKAEYKKFYQTIAHYLSQIGGDWMVNSDMVTKPMKDYTRDEWEIFVFRVKRRVWHWDSSTFPKGLTIQEYKAMFKVEEKAMMKLHGQKFAEFASFQVDKPHVGYIQVQDEYQRQGIGSQLYIEGAKWMAERGLRLYASSLQQPGAKAAWAKFEKLGYVKSHGERRYLLVE